MATENGGPAFPGYAMDDNGDGETVTLTKLHPGMSLRDYFAAAALQGLLAYPGGGHKPGDDAIEYRAATAVKCYRYADAMIQARETPC